MAINQIASSLVIVNDSEWSTTRMGTVFPRVDPLPSWLGVAAAAAEQKSCFDEAENRAASSLGVGG